MPNELSDEELIAGMLAGLEAPPEEEVSTAPADPIASPGALEVASPTLQQLTPGRRPQVRTVCETCRNSVWFTTPMEVKCYCRVMYLISWSNQDPTQFTGCDGLYIGQES